MKRTGLSILAALAALAGGARAETEAEYLHPGPGSSTSSPLRQRAEEQQQPRQAVRRASFAPAAAVNVKRMSAPEREERRFLRAAAASSRFEAEAARMALGKSSDPGVRSIAATLINHHVSASNDLLHLLNGRGMAAPMLANDQRKILNRLAKLQGAKFDREFLEAVALKYQQEDVQQYEKAASTVREPRLRAWIERNLPTLRYHLATAERIAPADARLAKAAASMPQAPAAKRFVARASAATRSMGSGPAPAAPGPTASAHRGALASGDMQFGGMPLGNMQFDGPAQLGVTRPVAARPNESSTR